MMPRALPKEYSITDARSEATEKYRKTNAKSSDVKIFPTDALKSPVKSTLPQTTCLTGCQNGLACLWSLNEFSLPSAMRISEEKTFEREVSPLLAIKDAFPKILIVRTYQPEYQHEGIRIVDAAEWLSNPIPQKE